MLRIANSCAEIPRAIAANQAVIVCGATRREKATQLPKICLALKRGISAPSAEPIRARSSANLPSVGHAGLRLIARSNNLGSAKLTQAIRGRTSSCKLFAVTAQVMGGEEAALTHQREIL